MALPRIREVCATPPAKMSVGAPAAAQAPFGTAKIVSPVPNRSSAWNETTRIEDEGKRFSGHLRREA